MSGFHICRILKVRKCTKREFEFHSENIGVEKISERAGFIVGELMRLLSEGTSSTHREVSWYAKQLHVSEKYLSATVKRITGGSVMSYIDRHTIPFSNSI